MLTRNILELIYFKTYTDLKAEAARSYLGLLWWIIEPVMYLCAFYVLFVLIMHRGDSDFVPTFLCAAVVWKWFDSGLKGGSQSISVNRGLLQQVYVPKFIFPVIAVLGSTARFIPVYLVFMLFLVAYGIHIHVTWLAAPVVILTQLTLVVALALLAGAITPFLPDIRVVIDNGLMMLFFLSGVFFDINTVQEPLRSYLFLNPMAVLIVQYRNVMLHNLWPNYFQLSVIFAVSLAIGAFALLILKQLDHQYGKVGF